MDVFFPARDGGTAVATVDGVAPAVTSNGDATHGPEVDGLVPVAGVSFAEIPVDAIRPNPQATAAVLRRGGDG